MKFKFNYLENTLWKLDGEYSYKVCENNHFRTPQGIYGTDGFLLAEQEVITFTFSHSNLKVCYQIANSTYQKTLNLPNGGEISFEFSLEEQINSS